MHYIWLLQSTYCSSLSQHCETIGRSINIVNLDPAAEDFNYPVAMGETLQLFGLFIVVSTVAYSTLCVLNLDACFQILGNSFRWRMSWRSWDWGQMVVLFTAWSILYYIRFHSIRHTVILCFSAVSV